MNIARTICTVQNKNVCINLCRKFRFTSINKFATENAQTQVQEEKFDFEDLKVLERIERRKPKRDPFLKNIFVSNFDRDLLAYSEVLNKDEAEAVDRRVSTLKSVFSDPSKTREDRRNAMKRTSLFAAPVSLTKGGLAMNHTESLRYLEAISSDVELSQEVSDHWVSLQALKRGLNDDQYQQIIDDLITGDNTIALCIKERLPESLKQETLKTHAELDGQGIWRITGEKVCSKADGFLLVLAAVEANRFKVFLVHPKVRGVETDGSIVKFHNTPATALDYAPDTELAQVLASSRLHMATICRCLLQNAVDACVKFVRTKVFSGKPLSELSTIQIRVADALLTAYASESAEYFTAGLADVYMEPDTELEMAACRNFMATYAIPHLLQLMSVPDSEIETDFMQRLKDMRTITTRGETLDGLQSFIAFSGIQHAGKMIAQEVKQMRNPLFHPSFIFKKMFAERHHEKDDPKLDLYLAEHLHPTLRVPAEKLEYCVLRMRYACETMLARHGLEVLNAYPELLRLADAATETLVISAVLARASRAYCIGLRHSEIEMKLAPCFVEYAKKRVQKLILDIDDGQYLNLDFYKLDSAKIYLQLNPADPIFVENPTSRVFW